MANISTRAFFGYNNRISPFEVSDNTLIKAFNVVLDDLRNIKKMNGYSRFNSSEIAGTVAMLGIFRHYQGVGDVAGTSKEMVAKTDVPGLVKFTDSTGVTTAITVSGAALDSTRPTWVTYRDVLIFTNGANAVKRYAIGGSATDLGGSPPTSKYITTHKERIFLAGNATNPSRVNFSDIFEIETYPAANSEEFGRDDGDQITGFASAGPGLIVWKKHSVWLFQGNSLSSFSKIKLSGKIGCVAPYSIAEVDGRWYFLAESGVYSTAGEPPVLESFPIEADINDIRPAGLEDVFGFSHRNKWYVMSFQSNTQTDTSNKRQVVLDVKLRALNDPTGNTSAWVFWDNQPINCATNWNAGDDVGETYFGETLDGFANRLDDGKTRAGVNFGYDIETKFYGDEGQKIWNLGYLDVEANNNQVLNISYITSQPQNSGSISIDGKFAGGVWGGFKWGDGTKWSGFVTRELKFPFRANAEGRFVKVRVRSSLNALDSTIRGLNLTYNPVPVFV